MMEIQASLTSQKTLSQNSPVSVEKTLKLLSQKPAAMRNLESTVVTKQLLRAFTR